MRGISDNVHGVILAISSSIFIGASFIIKKKGLKKASATGGTRAGSGGHGYLLEPMWWAGMLTMIIGEAANFAAYAYAPAILVTPLGALSIIVSAVLAHFILKERLHIFGIVGCILCLVGSVSIVLHAPLERKIESVMEVWYLATEPGFIVYTCVVVVLVVVLIFRFVPSYGQRYMVIYIGICSLTGSLTVMGVKAVGIALKLTFEGKNQFGYFQTWLFTVFVIFFCLLQLNYLNKALDTFNTAVVSPVYYVMFTTLTILASMIMLKVTFVVTSYVAWTLQKCQWVRVGYAKTSVFLKNPTQNWDHQTATQIITELCGFITILSGTFLLHKTKDMGNSLSTNAILLPKNKDIESNKPTSENPKATVGV